MDTEELRMCAGASWSELSEPMPIPLSPARSPPSPTLIKTSEQLRDLIAILVHIISVRSWECREVVSDADRTWVDIPANLPELLTRHCKMSSAPDSLDVFDINVVEQLLPLIPAGGSITSDEVRVYAEVAYDLLEQIEADILGCFSSMRIEYGLRVYDAEVADGSDRLFDMEVRPENLESSWYHIAYDGVHGFERKLRYVIGLSRCGTPVKFPRK